MSLTDLSSIVPSTSNAGVSTNNGLDAIMSGLGGGGLNASDIGQALGLAGTLSAGLSGNPNQPSSGSSGLNALPPAAQVAWLQTYLPAVIAQTAKGYQAPPLQRAATNPGMFQSQGLADLQKYSDQVGGLFGKTNSSPIKPNYGSTLAGASSATGNSVIATADAQANKLYGMSLSQYLNTQRPDVAKALGYQPGAVNVNDPNVTSWWAQHGVNGK